MEWGHFIVIFPESLCKRWSIGGLHPTTFLTAFAIFALYAYAVHIVCRIFLQLAITKYVRKEKRRMVSSYPPVCLKDAKVQRPNSRHFTDI